RSTAASWSSKIARVSCSRRPISVLLPSSTLPAVMKRSTPVPVAAARSSSPSALMLEITFLLAALHRSVGGLIIHARGAALGDGGQHGFDDDFRGCCSGGGDRAGAGYVAHR